MLPQPHGGKLINRQLSGRCLEKAIEQSRNILAIRVDNETIDDIEEIANGAFSPLEGFMGKDDFESCLLEKRLKNGLPWPIPIVFSISQEQSNKIKLDKPVMLKDNYGENLAILQVEEKFRINKAYAAQKIFGTDNIHHPGVRRFLSQGDIFIGGKISRLSKKTRFLACEYDLAPSQTRELFRERGWNSVAAFHTRNPVHRAHEYLQRCALEITDGLFIHPVVGERKDGDFHSSAVLMAYEKFIAAFYPKERVILAAFRTHARFAGPREALFHALVRKNFGCTHIVIGRDHAGVDGYYDTYAAHKIFDEFKDIGIIPLKFNGPFYCKKCKLVTTDKTCNHSRPDRVSISGTKIRKLITDGKNVPAQLMRPQVAGFLAALHKKKRAFL